MKRKLMTSALLCFMLINPMSAFASDNSVQEINQKAGENYEVEYKDGEVDLNKKDENTKKNEEDNKNEDVKEVGETQVKLQDKDGNEIKTEPNTKKTEVTADKIKDSSKEVYSDLKVVDNVDDDITANFITVVSNSSDNKPLTGFKYKLINDDNKKEIELDFSSKSELIVKVPDGSYTIKFVSGPEKYSSEEDIKLTMPMQDEKNKDEYSRQARVMLKHTFVKETPRDNPKTMDDMNVLVPILLSLAGLAIIGFILYNRRKDKKEEINK